MSAHRYWRVKVRSSAVGNYSYTAIKHLDFQDANGNSLCVGGMASASSSYAYFVSARAFPGGEGTWVSDNERAPWIQYDFGAGTPVEPAQIAIMATSYANAPIYMEVQYSDDGIAFTVAWVMTKPADWQLDATTWIFSNRSAAVAPANVSARYWMMACTQTRGQLTGVSTSVNIIIPEMRFLNGAGEAIAGYTSPLGSLVDNPGQANSEDWRLAWDGDPSTSANTASAQGFDPGNTPQFCHVSYPAPVAAYGLSILSATDLVGGSNYEYTPATGLILNSDDGISWAQAWQFSDANRNPSPPVGNGVLNQWNTISPPPPSPRRRCGPLIG